MSISEVKRLEADAKEKQQVRDKLKAAGPDPAKLAAIAAEMGYSLSADDIKAYMEDKKKAMSEEELDQVAGGGSTNTQTQVEQTAVQTTTCTTTTETATETDVTAVGPVVLT